MVGAGLGGLGFGKVEILLVEHYLKLYFLSKLLKKFSTVLLILIRMGLAHFVVVGESDNITNCHDIQQKREAATICSSFHPTH